MYKIGGVFRKNDIVFKQVLLYTVRVICSDKYGGNKKMQELLNKLNALYAKSKSVGLSDEEKEEQARLKKEYLAKFRGNFKKQLDNIDVKYSDGRTAPLSSFKKKK